MNALRSLRKEMQLTQVEAAQICGVSRRTYQTYEENGKNYKTDAANPPYFAQQAVSTRGFPARSRTMRTSE